MDPGAGNPRGTRGSGVTYCVGWMDATQGESCKLRVWLRWSRVACQGWVRLPRE
jgi:hypothetical protein